jgi:hypothetical protein
MMKDLDFVFSLEIEIHADCECKPGNERRIFLQLIRRFLYAHVTRGMSSEILASLIRFVQKTCIQLAFMAKSVHIIDIVS